MPLARRILLVFSLAGLLLTGSGCLFTKVLTVPMRVVGAAVSIVPVVGNKAHDGIDEAAELVDEAPF